MSKKQSELMKNAEKAAARVAQWSPAKQQYAERIIALSRRSSSPEHEERSTPSDSRGRKK